MSNKESSMEFFKQMFGGSWITQGIWVAAELGIADLLVDGPQTVQELAKKTQTQSGSLYRLMRALASVGIFAEDTHGQFSLTPRADMLRSDIDGSQRSFAIMMGAEFHAAWGELLYSVRTGKPGFQKHFGIPFFKYMTENPNRHSIYDAAMTGVHGVETEPMLDAYDFGTFLTVVDVGGGNGLVLAAILNRHPTTQGVLFDLPPVADRARSIISGLGLSDRCQIVGGDFFSSVPNGANAYVLRHIIHDWEDDDAIAILRQCQEAMSSDGKILVVEIVIPPLNEPSFGKWLDLMMLLVAGRERMQEEYSDLFSEAGLKLNRVIPTSSEVSIIEGVRA
jgi:hypothetical protein